MKKNYLLIIAIVLVILGAILLLRGFNGGEDNWIKDEKGIWIKHGNPAETPDYVLEQQEAINCALEKFNNFSEEKNSQCLEDCGDYAVDIVNVPRTSEDNLTENQCEDYVNGDIGHFIELDKEGNIVRIV